MTVWIVPVQYLTSFFSTETGFGNIGLKDGKPFLRTAYRKIEPAKVIVSGIEMQLINNYIDSQIFVFVR